MVDHRVNAVPRHGARTSEQRCRRGALAARSHLAPGWSDQARRRDGLAGRGLRRVWRLPTWQGARRIGPQDGDQGRRVRLPACRLRPAADAGRGVPRLPVAYASRGLRGDARQGTCPRRAGDRRRQVRLWSGGSAASHSGVGFQLGHAPTCPAHSRDLLDLQGTSSTSPTPTTHGRPGRVRASRRPARRRHRPVPSPSPRDRSNHESWCCRLSPRRWPRPCTPTSARCRRSSTCSTRASRWCSTARPAPGKTYVAMALARHLVGEENASHQPAGAVPPLVRLRGLLRRVPALRDRRWPAVVPHHRRAAAPHRIRRPASEPEPARSC